MGIPSAAAIIAAAGTGRRLGSRLPKALVRVAGQPLFLHSVGTFAGLRFVREIVVVLPGDCIGKVVRRYGKELERLRVTRLVAGGERRQDSVQRGLEATTAPIVLVHDAARPLVTAGAVRAVAAAAARHGAAVLAMPAVDTIKLADARGRVLSTPERSRVWHAQTPQGFRREILLRAYRKAGRADATDDSQLVERAGGDVAVVPSDATNFKVTDPSDLRRAAALLSRR